MATAMSIPLAGLFWLYTVEPAKEIFERDLRIPGVVWLAVFLTAAGTTIARMKTFSSAMASTAIPIVTVSSLSTAGALFDQPECRIDGWFCFNPLYFIFLVGVAVWLIDLLAVIGFAIRRRLQIASGVLVGLSIGALALASSCLVNIATLE